MAFFDRFKRKAQPKDKSAKDGSASAGKTPAKKPAAKAAALKDKPASTTDKPVVKAEPPKDSTAHLVLVRPIVSEKTSRLEAGRQYVFAVATGANKIEIKKAVERHYRVHVTKVNVVNYEGKKMRYGRTLGQRKDWRKAYVTIKQGESIVY